MPVSEKIKRLIKPWPVAVLLVGVVLTVAWGATLISLFALAVWGAF
jgi:hypothetical protein